MRNAKAEGLLDDILKETIPMHARMIHGRGKGGELYEESQYYDAHGRVRFWSAFFSAGLTLKLSSTFKP